MDDFHQKIIQSTLRGGQNGRHGTGYFEQRTGSQSKQTIPLSL